MYILLQQTVLPVYRKWISGWLGAVKLNVYMHRAKVGQPIIVY